MQALLFQNITIYIYPCYLSLWIYQEQKNLFAMATSSSNQPSLNPSPFQPSPYYLPVPLYPRVLDDSVRPYRRFVLAINWLSAFMLGMFNVGDLADFMSTQLRNDINAIIHGLWVEDLEGNRLKEETYTKVSYQAVERALYNILINDKEMAQYLHTHWSDLHNWAPIQWDQISLDRTSWNKIKNHFATVIKQFLKHGHPNQMTLTEYIYTVRELYRKIDLVDYFTKSEELAFEGNEKPYSIISNTNQIEVYSTCLSDAFFEGTRSQANFAFRTYKSGKSQNKRRRICVCYEVRVKFDLEKNMVDQEERFVCTLNDHNPVLPLRHKCVLLNHKDRKKLRE